MSRPSWPASTLAARLAGPALPEEAVPALSDALRPPLVFGPAALTTAAVQGADLGALSARALMLASDEAALAYDASLLKQLAFQPGQAVELQMSALGVSRLFRIRREAEAEPAIRLLVLMSPGDLMANTPLDFITRHLDVQLDLLFMVPGSGLPRTIPDHDLMFVASSEPDPVTLGRMRRLVRRWPRPVLNDPALLPRLARDRLPGLLSDQPAICSPATALAGRTALSAVAAGRASMADLLQGEGFPVLMRPRRSHAGIGLERVETAGAILGYLAKSGDDEFYVSRFHDYRSPDGLYRKYRVGFIDGRPYLCHMAVLRHWMVHYLNAGMAGSEAKRADEAAAMARFDDDFAVRHGAAFAALSRRLGFDFFSIDCGELPDGRLVLFEVDTAAIVHMMDPIETFPYKHMHMRRVFAAFEAMLRQRCPWLADAPVALRPECPFLTAASAPSRGGRHA